jgi:GH25 family lysozyme M1 (1,4-beta-N-acetylmuramidase)
MAGAVPDAVDLHEYWDLSVGGSAPWWALRHVEAIRRGVLPADWLIFIGECGSDGIQKELPDGSKVPVEDPQGRRGWQDRGKLTAAQQSANLAAYLAGCASSVAACFVFADGGNDPNWQTFHTFGTPVETAIRATWPQKAPQQAQDAPGSPIAPKEAPVINGIDVSGNQGAIEWPTVATQEQFAVIKAAEGIGWTDPRFVANWAGAKAAGLLRGAYAFGRPDLNASGAAEARYLLSIVGSAQPGDLPAVLDLEVAPADGPNGPVDLAPYARDWFAVADADAGKPVPLYSYSWFLQAHNLTEATVGTRPLWLAAYQGTEPAPPPGWSAVGITIWQNADALTVAGIGTPVDGDVTALTLDQLRALGKAAPPNAPVGGLDEMIQVTPAIQAAARLRLYALGGHLVPGGAIETELIARFALGLVNPQLATQTPTPVVGSQVALPNGRAYAMLDSGEICAWENGKLDNPEEKDRASIIAACWGGKFA